MALNAYLKLKGQTQGEIKGSVIQKGREGSIMVIAVSHEIHSPRDLASGLPTGRRQHKPLVITKELDLATPALYTALRNNETLTTVELNFWSPKITSRTGAGMEQQHYTIKLINAQICDIKFAMLNNKNPDLVRYAEYEEISFTYQKIEWVWKPGNKTAMDEWESPVV